MRVQGVGVEDVRVEGWELRVDGSQNGLYTCMEFPDRTHPPMIRRWDGENPSSSTQGFLLGLRV